MLRQFAREVRHGATLLPVGVAAVAAAVTGRRSLALVRLLGAHRVTATERELALPGHARLGVASVLSLLLGVVTLVPLAVLGLFVARGVLYGVVDRGPYDESWGGPSLAGAWLAHFAVGLLSAVCAIAALWLLAHLQRRVVDRLLGSGHGWWAVPVTVLVDAVAVLMVVGWLRQL